jgi:hypothetical protein
MPGSGCLTRARPHDARTLVAGGLGLADERGSTIIELIIRCGYHNIRIAKKFSLLTVYTEHFLVNYRPTLVGWCWVDLLVVIGLLCDVHVKYLLGVR